MPDYRLNREQLNTRIRRLLDAENVLGKDALTIGDVVMHAYASNLLLRLAEQAEAKRIKTPQIEGDND